MFDFSDEFLFSVLAIFIGFIYGVIAQRKQFCFSGGIKDLILFKHTRRTASLIVSITTAILATQLISYIYGIDLSETKYFLNINFILIVLGSIMFGYGMMISDGCSSRHLIKVAQGDKDSFFILLSLGIFSYLTYSILSIYNFSIYSIKIIDITTVSKIYEVPLYFITPILLYLLYKNLKKCMNFFQVIDGFIIGLIVSIVWYISAVLSKDFFVDISNQSLSFVYPLGKIIEFIKSGFEGSYLIFSVLIVFGVILGSFVSSRVNKQYSRKLMCDNSQQNPPSLFHKVIGGAFMGVGGILAVGCTVGEGLSGVSTLSMASFIAIITIYLSAYITAKRMHKHNSLVACFVFDFECKKKNV